MRTRTARWLLIGGLLALPAATLVGLAIKRGDTESVPVVADTTACSDAVNLAGSSPEVATARLEALEKAPDLPTDTDAQRAARQADRVCAAAALDRMHPPSITDRVFGVASAVTDWLGSTLVNRRLSLGDGPSAQVAWGVLVVEGLLVVLALRQYVLWRRERQPGPVSVGSIAAPTDDADRTGLGELIRDRLARAGVAPGTDAPGELAAVVVAAADIAGGDSSKNWLGQALAALGRAAQVTTGFVVTGKAFRDGDTNRPSVTLEAVVRRTSVTYVVVTESGDSYEQAAQRAAYALFLRLAQRPSIRTRTPSWLAWTSIDGLLHYQNALERLDLNSPSTALVCLTKASIADPGNLLVALQRGVAARRLAWGDRDENILRKAEADDMQLRQKNHLQSVRAVLQAVLCAPGSDDAAFDAAIALSYVRVWSAAILAGRFGPIRQQLVQLTEDVCVQKRLELGAFWPMFAADLCDRLASSPDGPLPDRDQVVIERYFRSASIALWRWIIAEQRYRRVLVRAWRLPSRRELAGRLQPRSSLRLARRQMARACMLATQWDQLPRVPTADEVTPLLRLECSVDRGVVRLKPSQRSLVYYNLSAAAARQAVFFCRLGCKDRAVAIQTDAIKYLDCSAIGPSNRLTKLDVDDFYNDPDFEELVTAPLFRRWVQRFGPESVDDRRIRVWNELDDEVRQSARQAQLSWLQRSMHNGAPAPIERVTKLLRPSAGQLVPAAPLNRVQVLNWFRHDSLMWATLDELASEPANGLPRFELHRLAAEIDLAQPPVALGEDSIVKVSDRAQWEELTADVPSLHKQAREDKKTIEHLSQEGSDEKVFGWLVGATGRAAARWAAVADWPEPMPATAAAASDPATATRQHAAAPAPAS